MFTLNPAVAMSAPARQSHVATNVNSVFANVCPHCGGDLTRIRRRAVDHVLSVLLPVRRFRCRDFGCIWVGNVRARRCIVGYAQVPV